MPTSAPTRRKSGLGSGGHIGRPYEKTGGEGVGAACMAARAHRCVGCTLAERTHRRGAHGASVSSSRNHRGPGHIEPGTGRIYNPPLRRGRGMVRSAECLGPGGGGPIKLRRKSGAGPGGHAGRPYEKTESGSVGADFISARAHRCVGCTLAERTHRRGAHGASGTGCELRRAGGRWTRSRRHVGMPPYARSDRRSALHTVAGGRAMRAPTPGAASEPRHTSKPSFGLPL